jgi:hypothetical protein
VQPASFSAARVVRSRRSAGGANRRLNRGDDEANMIELNFAALRCLPVLEEPSIVKEARQIQRRRDKPLRVGAIEDVLFVPELRLQVALGHVVPQEAIAFPWTLEFEIKRDFSGRGTPYHLPFEVERSDAEVCCLTNFYSRNFYHFVTEELVRAFALERAGFTGQYVLHQLPPFAGELLALLGVPESRMITSVDRPTVYKTATFVTTIDASVAKDFPDVYLELRELLVDRAGAFAPRAKERLWMHRGAGVNNVGRDLANPDEVYPLLERHGFEVIDLASLPAPEQVATVSRASALSGVHGAGFAHTLFMNPGGHVIECFAPTFINPGAFELCHILNHRYAMLVHDFAYAGYSHGTKVKVNCVHLELVLAQLDR